ncbi:MAG: hypothetical protein DWQ04_27230 [Chloroflexi bacterium]|nr:MAG: hypothetical protein DWQ04_27230 [Chloroflexota bacterium]
MSESIRMWTEISFNIVYLIVVYALVIAMIRHQQNVSPENKPLARLFIGAFALLALGDTGHVGFRVWAYALGDLESTVNIGSWELGLVGAGALATAVTVTFFYMIVLVIWQKRFEKPYGWFGWLLFAAAIVRLIIMTFPANEWNSTVPPQPWGIVRNAPLILQGLGAAYLILRDSFAAKDRTFIWVGIMIIVSYTFYMPVILFVQQVPMLGMLMIPKTLAYVAIATIAYRQLFLGASFTQSDASIQTV